MKGIITKLVNNATRKYPGNHKNEVDGVPIVLTASRAEISHFNYDPFNAFTCTFPHKLFPKMLLDKWLCPIDNTDGSNKFASYGLRKVEAMLANEFGDENVVVAHYNNLDKFIGPNTKLIGISIMDPMGLAFVSTTYNSLISFGGEALNAFEFHKLMMHPAIKKGSSGFKPKILVGGAGVWQIKDTNTQDEFGIDVLYQGEAEHDLVSIVKKLINGEQVEKYIIGTKAKPAEVGLIKHAATYGTVEITRGCGRGCQFCSPTMRIKYSFPLEHIMKEVETTVKHGSKMIFTTSEDIFLYKSHPGFKPNRQEVVKLYEAIAKYPGVEWIHISHASLAPIIYDPKLLEELSPILLEKTRWGPEYKNYKQRFITVEVGIETGSARLMKKYMKGKALPYSVDNWSELVVEGLGNMNDNDWWPLCSIMTGMPDENENDVIATIELIDELHAANAKLFYTPILFIPLEEALLSKSKRANLASTTELQWEFILRCWRYNIEFWDPEKKWIYDQIGFLYHWLYMRWKHGKKSTRPMMSFVGFPNSFMRRQIGKPCEPEYCESGKHKFFEEKFGKFSSTIKNGFRLR